MARREKKQTWGPEMEGEGNKSADRHYRERAEKFSRTRRARKAAKEAERAIEGDEGRELEEARRESGSHQPGTPHRRHARKKP